MSQFDVAIAGAGLTGLSLAAALRDSGLSIALIDPRAPTRRSFGLTPERDGTELASTVPPRVSAINQRSMNFLRRIASMPEHAAPYTRMRVWDQLGSAQMTFDAADAGVEALGYIVPNDAVSSVLVEALDGAESARFHAHEITSCGRQDQSMRVGFEHGDPLLADLVIGADGGNSAVRQMVGMRPLQRDDGQAALVTTLLLDRSLAATASQCFTEVGPLALLPVSTAHPELASIVWSAPAAEIERLLALAPDEFCQAVTYCIADEVGEVLACDQRFSFPLRRQFTPQFVKPGVVLAGDAAHAIHPLGGQGVNLGFADVEKLVELINAELLAGHAPGDGRWLRDYVFDRAPHNIAVATVMEAFNLLYGQSNPALIFLRNRGMRITDSLPLLKMQIARLASGMF
ncbi:MAG: hypothetical protein CMQ24_17870 [Gammaproteobacteria bacterium]|nr:hypothetical protein [Gammaproteobacteria bacterium]